MIGQNHLKQVIKDQVDSNTWPRFSILVGPEGSGKKTICKYVAACLKAQISVRNIGVDDIRQVVSEAYKVAMPIIYVIADADRMSLPAKNALLKVTEEPPQSAYFILTLQDANNTLSTIRSRGTIYYMDSYSADEIDEYYHNNHASYSDERLLVNMLCQTPREVDVLVEMGATSFYDFVNTVVDNIAEVQGANAFKIADRIKLKDSDENKYDLKLFWKAFMSICLSRLKECPLKYAMGIKTTSKIMQDLRINGISKQSTFDMWILNMREVWR